MSSVVIVTSQCYLLAEAINYIVINETDDSNDREWEPSRRSKVPKSQRRLNSVMREYLEERKPFNIVINFVPKGAPQSNLPQKRNSNGDTSTVSINAHGLRRTLKVFQDIVAQLREQIPDERFLDTLVDRFLTSIEEGNHPEKMEMK